jgi:hypothetical protein
MEAEPDVPDFWPRPHGLQFILLRPDGLRGGFIEHITSPKKPEPDSLNPRPTRACKM